MKPKSTYHHENLKEELLNAAVGLIGELGVQAFTLREVARRAGVSHNAPYRHFQDKDDLLSAVAVQGFDRLTATMKKAIASGRSVEDRFRLCGRGYLQFALRWPHHMQVMFDGVPPRQCKEAGERAQQTLVDCVVALQLAGRLPQGDPTPFSILAWSVVHGFAKLAIAERLPIKQTETFDCFNLISAMMIEGLLSPQKS